MGFKSKKSYSKILISLCLSLVLSLYGGGCSADSSSVKDEKNESEATVTSITLSSSTLNLSVNDTATLTATVSGTNLTDESKGVTWTSSRSEIVKVEDGKLTALAAGTARITATSSYNTDVSAYCDVTVEESTVQESTKNEISVGTSAASYNFSYTGNGATIYVYSQSSGLNFYGIKVGSSTWLVSDLTAQTLSSTTDLVSNGITFSAVIGSSSDTMTIESSSATINGTKYTSRLKTGGGGSQTSRCLKISIDSATDFVFYAVSSNSSSTRTMIVEVVENNASTVTIVRPTGISLDKTTASLERTDDEPNPTVTLTATITNAEEVTSGYDTITWTSSDTSVATVSSGLVKAVGAGSTTITASTVNGKSASCEVTVTSSVSAKIISLTDSPVGYASVSGSYSTSGSSKTVTTRSELLSAISSGGIIIIDGMIDMSEGKLPAAGTTSMTSTTALDSFVSSTVSAYSSYSDWIDKYTAVCTSTTEDGDSDSTTKSALYDDLWTLNAAYGALIKITLKSGTTLIGKDENCGIRGGSIQLSNVSNIQIRNLTLQDAVDPFPHHEVNSSGSSDGYNAQWDCITIQNTCSNIWIDHCTLEDTLKLAYTTNTTKEKWQIYDGLCDMKNSSTNISISNCIFKNHDKTMLIGSSDSDGDNSKRFVSLIGNYFYNCGQRLPMVRNTTIHILNNYYNADSTGLYSNSYAVGCRKNCIVYAENNYFGSGIQYSFKDSYGSLYSSGNTDYSSKGVNSTVTGTTLFSSAVNAYSYTAVTATEAKTNAEGNAGSGYLLK